MKRVRFRCLRNLSFLSKNRDSAMMAMILLFMIVHSQVAVLVPVGTARSYVFRFP